MTTQQNSFSTSAMLVSLNIRCYSARKEDKKISREVAENHATTQDAGRYNKQLVSKAALDMCTKTAGALRQYHYENTLPWLDDGVRVLPAANLLEYKRQMTVLSDQYDAAARDFISQWPQIVEDARIRLNGMFNIADYPTDIASRFGVAVRYMPIPDSGDFRVAVSDLERETLRSEIESSLSEASRNAMRDIWQRLSVSVGTMAAKLAAYKRDESTGKTENPFRDSLVENLRDLVGLIPRLNFTNDPALEKIRLEIESCLLAESADTLRESPDVRADVAQQAQSIADRINEFMA